MKYLVHTGISYNKLSAAPGDIVSDIPVKSVPWLLEQGHISESDPKPANPLKSEPKSPREGDK